MVSPVLRITVKVCFLVNGHISENLVTRVRFLVALATSESQFQALQQEAIKGAYSKLAPECSSSLEILNPVWSKFP